MKPARSNSQITALEICHVLSQFGYELKDLPLLGIAELFLAKAGDQVIEELYTFEHQGQQIALRPEFTSQAVQLLLQSHPRSSIVRWQFQGPVFRRSPSQSSDAAQRFSVGAELFGMTGPLADAEVMIALASAVSQIVRNNWTLRIGHVGLLRSALLRFELDSPTERYLLQLLPSLRNPSLGIEYVLSELERHMDTRAPAETIDLLMVKHMNLHRSSSQSRSPEEIRFRLTNKLRRAEQYSKIEDAVIFLHEWCLLEGSNRQVLTELQQLIGSDDIRSGHQLSEWESALDLLDTAGLSADQIVVQPALSRSWEYYTGMVFDVWIADRHVGGGGRYDDLARILGSPHDIPAIGFALDVEGVDDGVSLPMIDDRPVSLVYSTDIDKMRVLQWAQELRRFGCPVELIPDNEALALSRDVLSLVDGVTVEYQGIHYSADSIKGLASLIGSRHG